MSEKCPYFLEVHTHVLRGKNVRPLLHLKITSSKKQKRGEANMENSNNS